MITSSSLRTAAGAGALCPLLASRGVRRGSTGAIVSTGHRRQLRCLKRYHRSVACWQRTPAHEDR